MRKNILVLLGVVTIISLMIFSYWKMKTPTIQEAYERPAAIVKTLTIKPRIWAQWVAAIGSLSAHRHLEIQAGVAGKVDYVRFEGGEHVKKGDILVQMDPRDAKADLKSVKASLEQTRQTFNRQKQLMAKHMFAPEQFDQTKAKLMQQESAYEQAKIALQRKNIEAPFSGVLGQRKIEVGEHLQPGTPIAELYQVSSLYVDYSVPGKYLPELNLGQKITVEVPDVMRREITGKVNYIAPAVDMKTNTVTIRAYINNKDNKLRPGQFVKVDQYLGEVKNALVVPVDCVVKELTGAYVFVAKNGSAIKKKVDLGTSFDHMVHVLSGLQPGEAVIVEGEDDLMDGQLISIQRENKGK